MKDKKQHQDGSGNTMKTYKMEKEILEDGDHCKRITQISSSEKSKASCKKNW